MKGFLVFSLLYFFLCITCCARSPYRPTDPLAPTIITQWQGNTKQYSLSNSHLQEGPYFHIFDKKYFFDHLLPNNEIVYRHDKKTVTGKSLSILIENFLKEIKQNQNNFTDFIILKKKDFNWRDHTGLIIAKFKQHPFVLKLFIETPESFVAPLAKGFEPTCFFMMGGGVNRHLIGFTRIQNLETLQKKVAKNSSWHRYVEFPRKWFWLSKDTQWITITSKNIGPQKTRSISIPGTYAIIADHIDIERMFSLKNKNDRDIAMQLSNYCKQNIDPHINNYAIEKNTHKIVPIDTEHFPTMVGYNQAPECNNYLQWYSRLSLKMLKDTLGRNKQERRTSQFKRHRPMG
ncbi:MAG: hypothetical protein WDZ41_05165 [Candidatus Babeliales bacterium]